MAANDDIAAPDGALPETAFSEIPADPDALRGKIQRRIEQAQAITSLMALAELNPTEAPDFTLFSASCAVRDLLDDAAEYCTYLRDRAIEAST